MNLLRLLPGGTEAKLLVDNAIDSCTPIGNVRDDIYRCRALSEEPLARCLVHALAHAALSGPIWIRPWQWGSLHGLRGPDGRCCSGVTCPCACSSPAHKMLHAGAPGQSAGLSAPMVSGHLAGLSIVMAAFCLVAYPEWTSQGCAVSLAQARQFACCKISVQHLVLMQLQLTRVHLSPQATVAGGQLQDQES